MALLTASQTQIPSTVCPPARQLPASAAEHLTRLEQLAQAHRAGRLLVDTHARPGADRVVIDPRDVAAAMYERLGLGLP